MRAVPLSIQILVVWFWSEENASILSSKFILIYLVSYVITHDVIHDYLVKVLILWNLYANSKTYLVMYTVAS
jgi:hypothetical protein